MNSGTRIIWSLLSLLLVSMVGVGIYYAAGFVLNLFDVMDRQVAAITALAVVTILVSARIIAGGVRWSRNQESKDSLRLAKMDLYGTLVHRWSNALAQERMPSGEGEIPEVEAKIAILAGNSVIREYAVLRDLSQQENPDVARIRSQLERTIKEMRKDLLQNNLRLGDGEIMRVLQSARQ